VCVCVVLIFIFININISGTLIFHQHSRFKEGPMRILASTEKTTQDIFSYYNNQSINQSTNQPTNQPINQSAIVNFVIFQLF